MADATPVHVEKPDAERAAEQLVEAVQRLSAARCLEEVITVVKSAARRMTGADGATFVLRDGDLCYYVDEDAIGPLWKGRRFPMDICISGWAMRNRQPVIIPDIFVDVRIPHEAYRVTFVKSLAMVPIRSLKPIGAIGIYWRETHSPTPESVRWLQSLADSTALAIEHLQTRSEIDETRYLADLLARENTSLREELRVSSPTGLVKMCFITKRIEVNGRWLSIEAYLKQRFGLDVTHGVSPEALSRLEAESFEQATA
jgi:GAF domain-containing protein